MPTDEERLVVSLEARIRDFEKNMAKAERTGTQSFQGLRRNSRTATQQMEQDAIRSSSRINQAFATVSTKIGAYGKAFGGGLVAGIAGMGVVGIITQLGEVARGVAEVGDEAKRAGVSFKAFQELKFVAEQSRIGVDALTDGLKELNLRADEFILTGQGSSAEAFQRLGYSAETLRDKLKDPSALFTEIIGKLGQLDKAAQIRIADEIFGGTGGEKFVQLIEQGEDGIRDTIRAANDLGIVMDDELIKKAAEADRTFNTITTTVGVRLKTAIVEAAGALQAFLNAYRSFEEQYDRRMNIVEAGKAIGGMYGKPAGDIEKPDSGPADPKGKRLPSGTDILREKLIEQRLNEAFDNSSSYSPPSGKSGSRSSSSRSSSISETEREREAVEKLIAEMREELSLVGASDEAKRAAEATRRAGAAATEEERRQIVELNEALYQQEEAQSRVGDAADFFKDAASDALSDLIPQIETGNAALDRLVNSLIEAVAQAALLGEGPLAGLFGGGGLGSLFGGGLSAGTVAKYTPLTGLFANGTDFAPGGPSLVGEKGPEIVNMPRGAQVIPNHQLRRGDGAPAPSKPQQAEPTNLNVNITGASGDGHVRKLVQQGVSEALHTYNIQQRRGGFGETQRIYANEKG